MQKQNTAEAREEALPRFFIERLESKGVADLLGKPEEELNARVLDGTVLPSNRHVAESGETLWDLEGVFLALLADFLLQPDLGMGELLEGAQLRSGGPGELSSALEKRQENPAGRSPFALVSLTEEHGDPSVYYYIYLPAFRGDVEEAIREIKRQEKVGGMITLDLAAVLDRLRETLSLLDREGA